MNTETERSFITWPLILLALVVATIPYQLKLVLPLPEQPVHHASCFYHALVLHLPDILLLGVLVLSLRALPKGQHKKSLALLGAFLLVSLVSIAWGETASYPLALIGWFKLALAASLCVLFASTATEERREASMRFFFLVIVASGALQCGIVLMQFFTQEAVGLAWLGEPPLKGSKGIGSTFSMPGGALWAFDSWLGVKRKVEAILRAHGTFPHPNVLGGFLAVTLLALYPFFGRVQQLWKKWGLRILFFALFFALLVTFSRAALFAWALGTFAYVVLQRFPKQILKVVLPVVVISGVLMLPQLVERGGVISSTAISRFSNQERVLLQDTAISMIRNNPVKGVGFQQFVTQMDGFAPRPLAESEAQPVHNIFMLIAAEVGGVGLGLFLVFLSILLVWGWQGRRSPWTAALLAMLLGLLFIGVCDHYLLTLQHGRLLFFAVLGLLVASIPETKGQTAQLPAEETSQNQK